MQQLTRAYPALAIVAGTVLTGRRFMLHGDSKAGKNKIKLRKKFNEIEHAFAENKWMAKEESPGDAQPPLHTVLHRNFFL